MLQIKKVASLILVAEPTYADDQHAAVNAGIIHALALAFPREKLAFASTPAHRAGVLDVLRSAPVAFTRHDIDVLPPGGITLRRGLAQWRALYSLIRHQSPGTVVLLSNGPETFFVCRVLTTLLRSAQIFLVQHGGLTSAVGWRSRDPRHRWFDYRSGLAVARHSKIHLVVLEDYIKDAAQRLQIKAEFLVWPHPLNASENAPNLAWAPPGRLRIAFVGAAKRAKGFGDFIALARSAPNHAYEFELVGSLFDEFAPDEIAGIDCPAASLPRDRFIARLRAADYAFVSFKNEVYNLTASGSLLDCIGQLKPIIGVQTPVLTRLAAEYGPIGFLCPTMDEVTSLLADPQPLRDRRAYAAFQRSLDRLRRDRSPASLARVVREHVGARG